MSDQQRQARIQLDDKIVGIWFLETMPGQDWMASLREIEPDKKYELVYRFRYHKDDKPFDSADEKSWYSGKVEGTRQYAILGLREAGKQMERVATGKLYEYLNDKGFDDFWKRFQDAPFVFLRREKIEKT